MLVRNERDVGFDRLQQGDLRKLSREKLLKLFVGHVFLLPPAHHIS